jgi:pimeloyl-ACP methyl ester carboxylesterase
MRMTSDLEEFRYKIDDRFIAGFSTKNTEKHPTVFLHGWMDNSYSFLPLFSKFKDINAIAVDLPGHGKSEHFKAPYTLDSYVYYILKLFDKILENSKFKSVNLVGHSLGGVVGSLIASTFPDKLNKVIFLEAFGPLVDSAKNSSSRLKTSIRSRQTAGFAPREYKTYDEVISARSNSGDISTESVEILAKRGVSTSDKGGFYWNHDRYLKVPSAVRYSEEAVKEILSSIPLEVFTIYGTNPLDLAKPHIENRLSYYQNPISKVLKGGHHLHMEDSVTEASREIESYLTS